MNCLGKLSRDSGHTRVPEPPHIITGRILAINPSPSCCPSPESDPLLIDIGSSAQMRTRREAASKTLPSLLCRSAMHRMIFVPETGQEISTVACRKSLDGLACG